MIQDAYFFQIIKFPNFWGAFQRTSERVDGPDGWNIFGIIVLAQFRSLRLEGSLNVQISVWLLRERFMWQQGTEGGVVAVHHGYMMIILFC
jgi:hypothetical protein